MNKDIFGGNTALREMWMSGLTNGVREGLDNHFLFAMATQADPDNKTIFMVIRKHKPNINATGVQNPGFYISIDGLKMLAFCELIDTELEVSLHDTETFSEEDMRRALPFISDAMRAHITQKVTVTTPDGPKQVSIIAEDKIVKNSEFTYGVYPPLVKEILGAHFCDVAMPRNEIMSTLKKLEEGAMGSRRSLAAKLDVVCQFIGYVLTFRVVNGKVQFLVYKRTKKNNEEQLISVFSLAVGGHGENEDFQDYMSFAAGARFDETSPLKPTGIMDLFESIDRSTRREVEQEVGFYGPHVGGEVNITESVIRTLAPVGFVRNSKEEQLGYMGNNHFGLVYLQEAPAETRFEMLEDHNEAVAWVDASLLESVMFRRAYMTGREKTEFPKGDIIYSVNMDRTEDGSVEAVDEVLLAALVTDDFEPWSQYIAHNLQPLVDRILSRGVEQ